MNWISRNVSNLRLGVVQHHLKHFHQELGSVLCSLWKEAGNALLAGNVEIHHSILFPVLDKSGPVKMKKFSLVLIYLMFAMLTLSEWKSRSFFTWL